MGRRYRSKEEKWWDYSRGHKGLPGKGAAEDLDSDSFIDPEGGSFFAVDSSIRTTTWIKLQNSEARRQHIADNKPTALFPPQ